jgi:hypothetical protein
MAMPAAVVAVKPLMKERRVLRRGGFGMFLGIFVNDDTSGMDGSFHWDYRDAALVLVMDFPAGSARGR